MNEATERLKIRAKTLESECRQVDVMIADLQRKRELLRVRIEELTLAIESLSVTEKGGSPNPLTLAQSRNFLTDEVMKVLATSETGMSYSDVVAALLKEEEMSPFAINRRKRVIQNTLLNLRKRRKVRVNEAGLFVVST